MHTTIYYGKRNAIMHEFPELHPRTPGIFLIVIKQGRRPVGDANGCNTPDDVKSTLRTFQSHFKGAKQQHVVRKAMKRVRIAI